jgi:iron(III) transport system permease protein
VVNRLPLATRTGVSAMMQLDRSLEEAAEVKGARIFTRLRTLILPLTRKGFLAGFILSFVSTVKDLSLVVLLVTPQTIVLAPLAYGYLELGRPQFAYAVSLVIIFIVLICTWAMRRVSGADPFRGLGAER